MLLNIIKIVLIIIAVLSITYGLALLIWQIHWKRKVKRLREERRIAFEEYKKTDKYQEDLERMEWAREMVKRAEAYRVAKLKEEGLEDIVPPRETKIEDMN